MRIESVKKYQSWLHDRKGDRPNLQDANLQDANLQDANLQDANLRGANLQDANLQYANLQDANLRGAKLQYANLQYANLQDANLRGANLRGANLQYANLQDANLQDANLQDASLQYANLQYANLQDANLRGANLRGAKLQRVKLGCQLPSPQKLIEALYLHIYSEQYAQDKWCGTSRCLAGQAAFITSKTQPTIGVVVIALVLPQFNLNALYQVNEEYAIAELDRVAALYPQSELHYPQRQPQQQTVTVKTSL